MRPRGVENPLPFTERKGAGRGLLAGLFALSALLAAGGCRNISRFSTTGGGHYEGQVVSGSFVRSNVNEGTRMCLTLDTDHLQTTPGTISSSDGRFSATPLRQIPQIWHDPLSTFSFGEGRERNLLYMAAPQVGDAGGDPSDISVFLSLMDSGDMEVRLVRGAPTSLNSTNATNIFGVFTLIQALGDCPF